VSTVTPTAPWPHWIKEVAAATANTTLNMPTITSETTTIWTSWCETCLSTSTIWTSWVRERAIVDSIGYALRRPTEAEAQQNLRDRETADQRRLQVEGEKAAARDRAKILLQGHLDDIQRHDLASNGFFDLEVLSQDGSRKTYRINRKWSQNIQQIDRSSGRVLKTLCIHPRIQVPVEDSMLTQKLMLESGLEQELLRIANHF
jgi:hypothetical protein